MMENRKRVLRLINPRTEDVVIQEIKVRNHDRQPMFILTDDWGYGRDDCDPKEWIISDWTGKLDKSEKLIFEHDIIKLGERLIGEIRWNPGDCHFEIYNRLTGDTQLLNFDTQTEFEVKGNIHLFPELVAILEGESEDTDEKET